MRKVKILAIETSCDETAIALVEAEGSIKSPRFKVLKEAVASQVKVHRPFGGVVPHLAKREHLQNLPLLCKKICGREETANRWWKKINLVTVTVGPGLEPALWTGIVFAKQLAKKYRKPLWGANHLEGHLYSFLLPAKKKTVASSLRSSTSKLFPAVALIVSGGHTVLLLVKNLKSWKKLGETRDDAAGEAFDKVARLLQLPYPGGPELEKLASGGDPRAVNFPRPLLRDKSYDFSFSGLKTAVLYYLRDHPNASRTNVAASFQQAIVDTLLTKTLRAAVQFRAKSILLSGGVAANKTLRREMQRTAEENGLQFLVANPRYNTDNAVMIAAAGYLAYLRGKKYPLRANGALNI